MVQLQDYSDDDDMYLDPNDPPPNLQAPLPTSPLQDTRENVLNTDDAVPASDSNIPTADDPADSAVKTSPPPTISAPHSPSVDAVSVAPVPVDPQVSESPSSVLISATQEGLQSPDEADREKLEDDALEWLKQYVLNVFFFFLSVELAMVMPVSNSVERTPGGSASSQTRADHSGISHTMGLSARARSGYFVVPRHRVAPSPLSLHVFPPV